MFVGIFYSENSPATDYLNRKSVFPRKPVETVFAGLNFFVCCIESDTVMKKTSIAGECKNR